MLRKVLTPEQALQKLRHFCGYQERCHSEIKEKLYSLGVRKTDHDAIISRLIEENYLNEERFALAFARGKFRLKDWGRKKILYELKGKGVSDYCIRKAMKEIDDGQYEETARKLLTKKYASLKNDQYLVRKKKTIDYLLRKGYEPALVTNLIEELVKK